MFVDNVRYHKLISQGSSVGGTVSESVKARTDVSRVRVLSLTTHDVRVTKVTTCFGGRLLLIHRNLHNGESVELDFYPFKVL